MRQPETRDHNFVVGRSYDTMRGDITLLASIAGYAPWSIEQRLGFHTGRLANGYSLLVLTDNVGPTDFIWSDQTRYSGGMQLWRDEGAMVPRRDVLRGALLVAGGSDAAADAELWRIFGSAMRRINDAVGTATAIKIVPNIPHDPSMARHIQYPDANIGNIPQWTLIREKTMRCVANVLPGAIYG